MKPLNIEISAFAAFREHTKIDFSGLELFAISGPTGSGKSTILDALTYALYGHVARIGSKNLDTLISSEKTQMFVRLEFETARGIFRVTRTADKKPSGKVTRNTRIEELLNAKWKQLPDSEKLKDADNRLEQIVGLDYEGFTRAIFLPQGAFDEFLKGDASKRRKLLVKLLNLDRIENMQKAAGRLARDSKTKIESINERLEQDYAGADPKRKKELKEELSGLEQKQKETAKKELKLKKELIELERLKELKEEQKKLETTLATVKEKEALMEEKRVRLEQARIARSLLPELQRLESLELKQKAASAELDKQKAQSLSLEEKIERKNKELAAAKEKRVERIPEIENSLQELEKIKPLLKKLKERGGSLSDVATKPNISYSDDEWYRIQNIKTRLPELGRLLQTASRQVAEIENSEREIADINSRLQQLAKELNETKSRGEAAREQLNKIEKEQKELEISNQASAIRQHLQQGDQCPVCKNTFQPLPDEPLNPDLTTIQEQRAQAEKELNRLLDKYREKFAEQKTLLAQKEDREKLLSALKQRFAETNKTKAELLHELGADKAEQLQAEIQNREKELLNALAFEITEKGGSENAEEEERKLNAEKQEIIESHESLNKELQSLTHDLELSGQGLRNLEKQLAELNREKELGDEKLNAELAKTSFSNTQDLKSNALSEMDIKAFELELSGYEVEKESLNKRLLEINAKLSNAALDEALFFNKQEELKNLSLELETISRNVGRFAAELEQLEKELARAKSLREALAKEQENYNTYYALSLDLRGTELQSFLLTQVQSRLARRASDIILEVTDGRYDLRLIDGEFQVRDAWQNAEARNVKTLSGGETFVASLALALALSDTIAGHALGALFLDEGFGALDSETLESVATVLSNLSKTGRMVGVISHVKSLTDKMPACLSVLKTKTGSSVTWDLA